MRLVNPFASLIVLIMVTLLDNAIAHEDAERTAEDNNIQARLFAADAANGDVVAVEIPKVSDHDSDYQHNDDHDDDHEQQD